MEFLSATGFISRGLTGIRLQTFRPGISTQGDLSWHVSLVPHAFFWALALSFIFTHFVRAFLNLLDLWCLLHWQHIRMVLSTRRP